MTANLSSLPIHEGDNTVYTRMKALTWVSNDGLLPDMVQSSSGKLLAEIIRRVAAEKKLVVNFYGIAAIDDHSLDDVTEALKTTKREVVFINASQLQQQLMTFIQINPNIALHNGTVMPNSSKDERGNNVADDISLIEADILKDIVRRSYEFFPKETRLKSTPIYASGAFNARRIISNRKDFMWISLLMSEKLAKIMNDYKPKASRLLAVSLRASPFAGALGILGSHDIEIVDHMGPNLKILEEYTLRVNQEETNYIYIGDFVIGGTELKIAETYAVARNCIVNHAIVIGSLFDPGDYEGRATVHSLVRLKDAKPEATYRI